MELEGIRFLKGPQQTEEDTKSFLEECCANHPDCGGEQSRRICKNWYDKRATSDPRSGGWGFSSRRLDKPGEQKYISDVERYAESIPILTSTLTGFARERILRIG